ncbi:MAG: FtsX-like permease family protein [Pseudohongiellaceae bacterium]
MADASNLSRNPVILLRLALRLLWRDWQGGELRLLFLALVMAVTSVTGIALFTDRLESALVLESANMLAADRVVSGRQQPPRIWLDEARERGLRTAETLSFTSMAFSDTANVLVAAKAVSDSYPLRGELLVADQPFAEGVAADGGPPPGEVWLESRALAALNVEPGDTVYVGEAELRLGRVIILEPDRQQGGMVDSAGPRLMLNIADVPTTNVIQTGSRASYRYLFAGDIGQLDLFSTWLRDQSEGQYRLRDVRDESEEVSDALSRAESFLMLGSLFAVLLAGVAIALTARRYSERHFDYVAILKTLGCTSAEISRVYLLIQVMLAVGAILVGWVAGWLVHEGVLWLLRSIITVNLPAAGLQPFVLGSVTAFICLLSFALPPLLALKGTPPLRVLRKDIDPHISTRLPYLFGIGGSLVLIYWYSQDFFLTSVLVLSLAGIAVVLGAVSYLMLRTGSSIGMKAGSALKLAMSAVRRRRRQNILQVLVFSVTIMSLLILTLLRTDLIDDWEAQLPEDAPNHFMMNITQPQVEGIQNFLAENSIEANAFYPMISARVLSVNGEFLSRRDDDDQEGGRGTLTEAASEQAGPVITDSADEGREESGDSGESEESGDSGESGASGDSGASGEGADVEDGPRRTPTRQVTWAQSLPPDNQVVSGRWWAEDFAPGEVSVEEQYAGWLDIELGDTVQFEVNQQSVEAEVTSLRSVRWDNMQPNFYFIFSPGTLDHLGATFLSTVLMEQEQKILLNDLLRMFPTIVVIEIDALIEQIRNIIAQVTSAIELISFLVLFSGALVLLACVNATLDERFHENAILRTLGAGRRLILGSLLFEFATIGVMAGIIATVGAEVSLYYLQEQVFEQEFRFHFWVWLAGPLLGMVTIAALGVNSTRRVVNSSPLSVLRGVS